MYTIPVKKISNQLKFFPREIIKRIIIPYLESPIIDFVCAGEDDFAVCSLRENGDVNHYVDSPIQESFEIVYAKELKLIFILGERGDVYKYNFKKWHKCCEANSFWSANILNFAYNDQKIYIISEYSEQSADFYVFNIYNIKQNIWTVESHAFDNHYYDDGSAMRINDKLYICHNKINEILNLNTLNKEPNTNEFIEHDGIQTLFTNEMIFKYLDQEWEDICKFKTLYDIKIISFYKGLLYLFAEDEIYTFDGKNLKFLKECKYVIS